MYSPRKIEAYTAKELKDFDSIVKNHSRGTSCNWCQFTYNEIERFLITIYELQKENNRLKNVKFPY